MLSQYVVYSYVSQLNYIHSVHSFAQDGQIDAEELQRCLTASGIGGTYQPFSKETCRIMISMLDRDYSGKMGFNEFKELWAALNQWKVHVNMHKCTWLLTPIFKICYLVVEGYKHAKETVVWWLSLGQVISDGNSVCVIHNPCGIV